MELRTTLMDVETPNSKKKQLRNQISAFQARLKQRITNMDQELRLEQKNQQLSTILSIVVENVKPGQLGEIFGKIDEIFPEIDIYNSTSYAISFPELVKKNKKAARKPRAPKVPNKKSSDTPDDEADTM